MTSIARARVCVCVCVCVCVYIHIYIYISSSLSDCSLAHCAANEHVAILLLNVSTINYYILIIPQYSPELHEICPTPPK